MQLTQPVGRQQNGAVCHLATLTWDACGRASMEVHSNFLYQMMRRTPFDPLPRSTSEGMTAEHSIGSRPYPLFFLPELNKLPDEAKLQGRLSPESQMSRSSPQVALANPFVRKQPCTFDFRQPTRSWAKQPYFFTWQAFNVLLRWRCALTHPVSCHGQALHSAPHWRVPCFHARLTFALP